MPTSPNQFPSSRQFPPVPGIGLRTSSPSSRPLGNWELGPGSGRGSPIPNREPVRQGRTGPDVTGTRRGARPDETHIELPETTSHIERSES